MLRSQKFFWDLQLPEEIVVWAPQKAQKPFIQVEITHDFKSRCTMSYPLILNARANYLSHLTQCHAAPVCALVLHKRCSNLQYLPHKKRFMISKNLANVKAIIHSVFLQSCTTKELSPSGFKNWKEKSPLLLFPNKDSIIKPFSLFSIFFPLMSGTGLNLQTSLDGLYYRDVHD